jgi:hypothetical protein
MREQREPAANAWILPQNSFAYAQMLRDSTHQL